MAGKRQFLKVDRRSKAAREALADLDYVDKLDPVAKAWLETYMRATAGNSVDDMSLLVGGDKDKLARLQKQVFAEDNARRRDITYVGQQVPVDDDMDGETSAGLGILSPEDREHLRCGRCCKTECECGPRFRAARYGQADYLPVERTEDTMLGEIDLRRRMQAFDLLPYGDSPRGLEQGHTVKVCLPFHLLDKSWGYVLDFRPLSGEYLVRSMSKRGLRDKDGTAPKATVLWAKPDALKRFRPLLAKGNGNRSDKNSTGGANNV